MAAVTTDIPPSWRSPRPTCLRPPVPDGPSRRRPGSVRLVGGPPSAEVRHPARVPALVDPIAGRALLPSRPSGSARAAPSAYRLRRAVAVAVMIGLALAVWLGMEALAGALGVAASTTSASATDTPVTIVVAPGDTFWSIASRVQPQGDLRPLIDRLVAAHGRGVLQAGERIAIPRT